MTHPAATTCPWCYGRSDDGLLCASDTANLVTDLRGNAVVMGVAELVDNLHVAQAKLARIGEGGSSHGPLHERAALNFGAMEAVRDLELYLTGWARDLTGDKWRPRGAMRITRNQRGGPGPFCPACLHQSCADRRVFQFAPNRYVAVQAADVLFGEIDAIRRHGAVKELVQEITRAIDAARRCLDVEPFTRFPVGPCPEECDRTVFALCPAEGSQRPALMACYLIDTKENRPDLGAGFAHSWDSIQFFRTGIRIKRKMAEQERRARIDAAVFGEGAA